MPPDQQLTLILKPPTWKPATVGNTTIGYQSHVLQGAKMKITKLVQELNTVLATYGDIEVELQEANESGVISYPDFFIIPEEYEEGWQVCLRTWPY
jgi:hypothetical protein